MSSIDDLETDDERSPFLATIYVDRSAEPLVRYAIDAVLAALRAEPSPLPADRSALVEAWMRAARISMRASDDPGQRWLARECPLPPEEEDEP